MCLPPWDIWEKEKRKGLRAIFACENLGWGVAYFQKGIAMRLFVFLILIWAAVPAIAQQDPIRQTIQSQ